MPTSRELHIRRESIPLAIIYPPSWQPSSPAQIQPPGFVSFWDFPFVPPISRGKGLELRVQFVFPAWAAGCLPSPLQPSAAPCIFKPKNLKVAQCWWWDVCTHHSQICNYLSPELILPQDKCCTSLSPERQGSTLLSPCWTFPVSLLPSSSSPSLHSEQSPATLPLPDCQSLNPWKMDSHHFILFYVGVTPKLQEA